MHSQISKQLVLDGYKVVNKYTQKNDLITTEHQVANQTVLISGKVADDFPYKAPVFYLENRSSYGLLAHVGWSSNPEYDYGDICYGNKDTFNTDYNNPYQVYVQSLSMALEVLSKALSDSNWNISELNSEYMAVWAFHSIPPKFFLLSFSEQTVDEVDVYIPHKKLTGNGGKPIAISLNSNVQDDFELVRSKKNLRLRQKMGRGLTFKVTSLPPPPAPLEPIMSWWEKLLAQLTPEEYSALGEYQDLRAKHLYIFINSELNDDPIWIGIEFNSNSKNRLPLSCGATNWQAKAFSISPVRRDVLIPRSAGSEKLSTKHVCVIGCGSVGSQIVRLLASSGIGKFTLFDGDQFEIANLHKHALPASSLGFNKAQALNEEIKRNFPFVEVASNVNYFKLNELGNLGHYDIIISATGFLSFERALEAKVRTNSDVPLLFAWNEPFGIGGHVLVNQQSSKGCLNCTFVDLNSSNISLERNWLHFIEPGQNVLEKIGGCGFDFISFSAIDAMKTATLASEVAIDVLEGRMLNSKAKSWVGSSNKSNEHNLKLSHRYLKAKCNLLEVDIYTDGCPICT